MDKYVNAAGDSVLLPFAVSLALRRKFSPILTLKMKWHLIFWYPGGRSFSAFTHFSNSGLTFFISLQIASHHKVLPFSLSNTSAYSIVLGTRIPNLCVRCQFLLDLWQYLVPFLYVMFHPQCKHRFIVNSVSNSIFGDLHRVRLFHIFQSNSIGTFVFPLA